MDTEFVQGIMIAAASFITVTGILFAVGLTKNYIGNIAGGFLLLSVLLGAISILCSLVWFSTPKEYTKNVAFILLASQFFTWYIPSLVIFIKMFYKSKKAGE